MDIEPPVRAAGHLRAVLDEGGRVHYQVLQGGSGHYRPSDASTYFLAGLLALRGIAFEEVRCWRDFGAYGHPDTWRDRASREDRRRS